MTDIDDAWYLLPALAWALAFGVDRTASGCYREAAQIATDIGDYKRAIERWEQVAQMSLDSNLTRYSVKDYYLNAGMCYLAIPVSPVRARLREHKRRVDWHVVA